MSGRRRATLSPSLFPFLAVLVCTLGTLILLLALVAQKAEQTAQQIAENQDQPELDALAAEQQWRLQQFISIRSKQTDELEKRRSELAHVEDHLRRLRSELQQLQAQTAAAADPADTTTDRQAEWNALRQKIEQESERVAQLRQQAPLKRPRVVIVPHKGPNGTDRRPVYVECTADGIFLRPEDARIAAVQLDGPLGPGNPLDAALRAVRNYWQQHDPGAPPPYPLLVVRPDGIDTYAIARAAMADWDDQFGYELVPADVELAFPKPQPDLRRQVDLAIRQAVVRQHAQLAGMPRRYRSSAPLPILSAAELNRRGSAAGGASGNGQGELAAGRARGTAARSPDPLATGEHRSPAGAADNNGSGASGNAVRDFDDALRDTAAAMAAEDRPRRLAGGATGMGDPLAGLDRRVDGAADGPSRDNLNGGSGDDLGGGSSDSLGGGPDAAEATRDGAPQANSATAAAESTVGGDAMAGADATAASRGSAAGKRGSSASGNGGSLAAGSAAGQQLKQSAADGRTGGQTQPSPSGNATSVSANEPPLRRDRDQWALPEEMAGARGTAIMRPIHLTCRADAFVMYGESDRVAPQEFAFGNDGMVDRAALQLAAAVQRRVQSWGLALPGGRWQPVLAVEVDDGAEMRFRQLRTLLTGSGLTLERR